MKTIFIFFAAYCMGLQACNTNPGGQQADAKLTDNADAPLINKQRCSFKLPGDLSLRKIDTTMFSPEGYFKIAPPEDEGMMQIFVYDEKSDVDEKISEQEKALNTPEIFTANNITPIKHWGKYYGKGIRMDGTYKGGIIKGLITVFAYTDSTRSFVIIRQDIGMHESVRGELDGVEHSFILK